MAKENGPTSKLDRQEPRSVQDVFGSEIPEISAEQATEHERDNVMAHQGFHLSTAAPSYEPKLRHHRNGIDVEPSEPHNVHHRSVVHVSMEHARARESTERERPDGHRVVRCLVGGSFLHANLVEQKHNQGERSKVHGLKK